MRSPVGQNLMSTAGSPLRMTGTRTTSASSLLSTLCFERSSFSSAYLVHDLQHVLRHVRQPDSQDGHRFREINVAHLMPVLQKRVHGRFIDAGNCSQWSVWSGPCCKTGGTFNTRTSIYLLEVCGYVYYCNSGMIHQPYSQNYRESTSYLLRTPNAPNH